MTAALRLFKKRKLSVFKCGALEVLATCRGYNPRPLYVQIECDSQADNLARLKVSYLHEEHSEYAKYAPLNGLEFNY